MTATTNTPPGAPEQQKPETVDLTIDGIPVTVEKNTLVIRAAEQVGIQIPRFCDHPLLDPVGACRQCLVEVAMPDREGNLKPMPKPQASCTMTVAPGMEVKTQVSSPVADKAQRGVMELLLINHPLDCPICDKGGECPLQNQAMANGRGESRYDGVKRTYPKPINISAQVLLDRERCVLCQRCTRFADQIAGDPFINLQERGAVSQIGAYQGDDFNSYFSGNVIQICPVGALTSAEYRFRSRPFDLVSTVTTCEHCAAGCQLRTDHRHYEVKRRNAGNLPDVNEEWNCDKGRFAFRYGRGDDRVTTPLVRHNGVLEPASWAEALQTAAAGLTKAGTSVGVLTGGRLPVETCLSWSRFARVVLGTNNVDFRSRPHSAEEAAYLAARVAGHSLEESVTYADLETASRVVLVDLEPEDECPMIFLRLRKAWRRHKATITVVGTHLSNGSAKIGAELARCLPGQEPEALAQLVADGTIGEGTIVLVGERAATRPGTLSAINDLDSTVRVAWVPRRAGEMGAIEAGLLPQLLPGGRLVDDAKARVDIAAAWGVTNLPTQPGLDTAGMLAAAQAGKLDALVVSGVELADMPDPTGAREAVENCGFVVSVEQRFSEVSARADVVLPVCLLEETSGTFLDWEHRPGRVRVVNKQPATPMNEIRVLDALSSQMGSVSGLATVAQAHKAWRDLGQWSGGHPKMESTSPLVPQAPMVEAGSVGRVLETWRQLLEGSASLTGADALVATAPAPVAVIDPLTAEQLGVTNGQLIDVCGPISLRVPVKIDTTMTAEAVWIPSLRGDSTAPQSRTTVPDAPGTVVSLSAVETETSREAGVA